MEKIFLLLGLVETHSLKVDISRDVFIRLLESHVGTNRASSMDIFSTGNYDYRGSVGETGFVLRRVRGLIRNTRHYCRAFGTFREDNGKLTVDVTFRNFPTPVYFYFIMVVLSVIGCVVPFLSSLMQLQFVHAMQSIFNLVFVAGISVVIGMIIRSTSSKTILDMRYEMERNFNRYLTTKVDK